MATVLRSFDWTRTSKNKVARSREYPWVKWLDGRIWLLEPGEDFDGPPSSMERAIRTTATRKGVKVHVRVTDTGVVLQKHTDTDRVRRKTTSPSKAAVEAQRQQEALEEARAESKALREARAQTNGHVPPVRKIKRRRVPV